MTKRKSYTVEFAPRVRKQLNIIPTEIREKILEKISDLKINPTPEGVKALKGMDAFRIRQGDYRIVYTINDQKLVILIIKVGHRKDIYC